MAGVGLLSTADAVLCGLLIQQLTSEEEVKLQVCESLGQPGSQAAFFLLPPKL
jgi:hypothetical protein